MPKFHGPVGYVETVETAPGVWQEVATESDLYGNVERASRTLSGADKVNDDISVENVISIMADAYAQEHFSAIRYVKWAGTSWKVTSVTVERPRLLLRLGGVYNGLTP